MGTWWSGKIRQVRRHLTGHVTPSERAQLERWLDPIQLALFDTMHRADQRHGLDVVAALRASGDATPELLHAGLFHDASKGPTVGLDKRIAWSLGERYGQRVWSLAAHLPGYRDAFERIRHHPDESARLAMGVGCSWETGELIRHQADPRHSAGAAALQRADEAS